MGLIQFIVITTMNIIIASFIITPTTQMSNEREMKNFNALGFATLVSSKEIKINTSKKFADIFVHFAET